MNAAVTGGTGFLGSVLVRLLVERCDEVRVLLRRPDSEPALRALGAIPVRGDLTQPDGCAGLVSPGDTVFHAAARVSMTGPWSQFQRTTVEGTRRLLNAALRCEPARIVYVSSAAVYLGAGTKGPVSAERTPAAPPRDNYYARSKFAAEQLVRAGCEQRGCPWTIVRPGFVYGPGNRALLEHFAPLVEKNRLYVIGDGTNRIAVVCVDDAARAVLLAGTHPAAEGKIYDVASDEHVTQADYLEASAAALGLPAPRRRVGRRTAYTAAALTEAWARLHGTSPPFTRAMVGLMSADQVLDAGRIRKELGWRPQVTFAEGMRRAAEWHAAQRRAIPG